MVATPTHLLDQTITVNRQTDAVDSGGSPTRTWSSHLTGVRARVQPMSGSESVRYGRDSTRRMWRLYVDDTHDIVETDRVIYGTKTFEVTEVVDLQEHGAIKRLICEETL